MNEKRGLWFLLTGAILGLAAGILIAWSVTPTQYVDTNPSTLRTDFKDNYRYLIASAFASNKDLPRAQARLATLGDPNPVKALGEQAQRMLANNTSIDGVQILADLSQALQNQASQPAPASTTPPVAIPASETPPPGQTGASAGGGATATLISLPTLLSSDTPGAIEATALQTVTSTPAPSQLPTIPPAATTTMTPTTTAPFRLANQGTFCNPATPGLLEIFLTDPAGKPAAGLELVITWFGGEEHFFTGLKPEISNGYADYGMLANTEYALTIAASGSRVTGLTAPVCTDPKGNAYPGGIKLEFTQQ